MERLATGVAVRGRDRTAGRARRAAFDAGRVPELVRRGPAPDRLAGAWRQDGLPPHERPAAAPKAGQQRARDPDVDVGLEQGQAHLAQALLEHGLGDAALPAETVVFGEISLSGALRPASQTENRLKEAQKLGFTSAIAPRGGKAVGVTGIALNTMSDLTGFVGEIFGAG